MHIRVIFLGPSRELAQRDEMTLEIPDGATVSEMRSQLESQCPSLQGKLKAVRFAINNNYALDGTAISDGDEIALIPPVSGGLPQDVVVDLMDTTICADAMNKRLGGDTKCGGQVTFVGMTREEKDEQHGQLVRLDYEAYADMAKDVMRRLADEARQRWSLRKVVIVHRVGPVALGEIAVYIGVTAGHRAECFDACRWLIDAIKQDAPIWKKDVFEDGYVRWSGSPHVEK